MKKNFTIIFVITILFSACSPSSSSAPFESVPTSAETKTFPTATVTKIPLTSTSTLTPAPIRTATSTPTRTVIVSQAIGKLIVEEHELRYYPDISTDALRFEVKTGNAEEVLAKREKYRDHGAQLVEYNNNLLQPFGYKIEEKKKINPEASTLYDIYKDNQLYIKKPLFGFSPVSINQSKDKFVMGIELSDGSYTLTNESLTKDRPDKIRYYPIYVGNDLLGETYNGDQTQFVLGKTVVYSDSINDNTMTISRELGPWGYGGHWAVEFPHQIIDNGKVKYFGDIIQDGESINHHFGYEQSFGFATLNDVPFYFYQKDGKIGISYAQKENNTGYDEILHNRCCSAGLLNIRYSQNMAWFFARRGDIWYYVEAYVNDR